MFVAGAAARAARGLVLAAIMSLTLVACGGGGSSETPPPTELPTTLQVTAPTGHAALGTAVAFSSNAADPRNTLSYRWQFGDGATSTEANPSHTYARTGVYAVQLTVTNEAGITRSGDGSVSIADLDIVRGKSCSGGWCWQRPLPQGNPIYDYFYVNDKLGWAVGEGGTILVTNDGGVTWTAQNSGTELNLNKVVFVDAQVGWITSSNGQLLKTSDGGAHWLAVSTGQNETGARLAVVDANNARFFNSWGSIVTTRDGGVTWTRGQGSYYAPAFVPGSMTDVWAIGYYGSDPLQHSTDGGTTWTPVNLPPAEANLYRSVASVQFADASHGWVLGQESGYVAGTQAYVTRALALRTVDGGASWLAFTAPSSGQYYSNNYAMKFVDRNIGFAWSSYPGAILRTVDGGMSWQPASVPATLSYYTSLSLQAYSAQVLLLKEDYTGRVHLSTDGGSTWAERAAGGLISPSLNSVWFFDSREGLAIGADGSSTRTTDGGQTWVTAAPLTGAGWRRAQFLADDSVGWVISDNGSIYRSTDKGKSWLSPVPQTSATFYAHDYHFIDAQNGWAVTPYGYSTGTIYRSVDGGSSWQPVAGTSAYTDLVSIRFADPMHGVAVGPVGVARVSVDGGQTWTARPTGIDRPLRRVSFIDAQTAIAVGESGAIVRSTDRGHTWTRITSGTTATLNDVHFLDGKTGWAVGENGTVLTTSDGGLSWSLLPSGTRWSLQSAFFIDERTGWLVGDNGSILATATGGR